MGVLAAGAGSSRASWRTSNGPIRDSPKYDLVVFLSTIVFVNQYGYFGPCIKLLARAQEGLDAIEAAVLWSSDARDFAAI